MVNSFFEVLFLPERHNFHNRRSTTCGQQHFTRLPKRQDNTSIKFCLSGRFLCFVFRRRSLTCGYENYAFQAKIAPQKKN